MCDRPGRISASGPIGGPILRLVQGIAKFAQDGKARFSLAEPPDRAADPLAGPKFEAESPGGVARDDFRALHPLGSGTSPKVETGHADTSDLKPDEGYRGCLRDRIKAGGTLWIVAVPEDGEIAATFSGAGAEPEANRLRLSVDGEPPK